MFCVILYDKAKNIKMHIYWIRLFMSLFIIQSQSIIGTILPKPLAKAFGKTSIVHQALRITHSNIIYCEIEFHQKKGDYEWCVLIHVDTITLQGVKLDNSDVIWVKCPHQCFPWMQDLEHPFNKWVTILTPYQNQSLFISFISFISNVKCILRMINEQCFNGFGVKNTNWYLTFDGDFDLYLIDIFQFSLAVSLPSVQRLKPYFTIKKANVSTYLRRICQFLIANMYK